MKPLVFLSPAEQELSEAAEFYEARRKGLGRRFLDAVESAGGQVQSNPRSCPIIRAYVRRKLIVNFPYGLLYRDDPDEIVVLALMHLHRRPGYWLNRL